LRSPRKSPKKTQLPDLTREQIEDNIDYTTKRKAHQLKQVQIEARNQELSILRNQQQRIKERQAEEKRLQGIEESSDSQKSEESVHRPFSGGKIGNEQHKIFNEKFMHSRKTRQQETIIKGLSNDEIILALLQIHDAHVTADPSVREVHRSKWASLRQEQPGDAMRAMGFISNQILSHKLHKLTS
jgi:hypothetical protein